MRDDENMISNGSLWFSDTLKLRRLFVVTDELKNERFIVSKNEFFDGYYTRKDHEKLSLTIDQCNYRRLG